MSRKICQTRQLIKRDKKNQWVPGAYQLINRIEKKYRIDLNSLCSIILHPWVFNYSVEIVTVMSTANLSENWKIKSYPRVCAFQFPFRQRAKWNKATFLQTKFCQTVKILKSSFDLVNSLYLKESFFFHCFIVS